MASTALIQDLGAVTCGEPKVAAEEPELLGGHARRMQAIGLGPLGLPMPRA
jgi:hypothetical protein